MNTFESFLKGRRLELNVEKTKVVVFNKQKNVRKEEWRWNRKRIEEVVSFKYLGFIFNRMRNYKDHIKDLSVKGRKAANKVWKLGERIYKDDFLRRFVYLVKSVMEYEVEIWE